MWSTIPTSSSPTTIERLAIYYGIYRMHGPMRLSLSSLPLHQAMHRPRQVATHRCPNPWRRRPSRGLARGLAAGLVVRHGPAYSHEAQGSIERYRSTLRRQVRTLREAVKVNDGGFDIKASDRLMTWLAKRAACIYHRYLLHTDGQTSCARR